jgi:hypothetical protein
MLRASEKILPAAIMDSFQLMASEPKEFSKLEVAAQHALRPDKKRNHQHVSTNQKEKGTRYETERIISLATAIANDLNTFNARGAFLTNSVQARRAVPRSLASLAGNASPCCADQFLAPCPLFGCSTLHKSERSLAHLFERGDGSSRHMARQALTRGLDSSGELAHNAAALGCRAFLNFVIDGLRAVSFACVSCRVRRALDV